MNTFKFTPEQGFRDASAFPNPASETETRNQFQIPLDQLRDYINTVTNLKGSDVIRLRVKNDNTLEFSHDGTTWSAIVTPPAVTATKLATARQIALSGDATGNAMFDGSANISISTTVRNRIHIGTTEPDNSLGENGDIFIKVGS